MNDLISRKALLEELEAQDYYGGFLVRLITNAPAIEQVEPVAVCTANPLQWNESTRSYEIKWMNGNPIEGWLYTAPPQPQEQDELVRKAVKDALEKAASICEEQGNTWDSDSQITHLNYAEHCAWLIRALIEKD